MYGFLNEEVLGISQKTQQITPDLKNRIGRLIVDKVHKTKRLHEELHISIKCLRKWAKVVKKGCLVHGLNGRPRSLDQESCDGVRNFLTRNQENRLVELRRTIRLEAVNTKARKLNIAKANVTKAISYRSTIRYEKAFMNFLQNN